MWNLPRGSEEGVGNQLPTPTPFSGAGCKGGLIYSRGSGFIAGTGGEGQSENESPGPVSPRAFWVTLRNKQSLHARKETRGDGRALLHPNKIRCTDHRPPRWSLCLSPPAPERALQSSLSLACLPSLPTALVPKCLVPCKGLASSRVARAKALGPKYCQVPGQAHS